MTLLEQILHKGDPILDNPEPLKDEFWDLLMKGDEEGLKAWADNRRD